MDDKRAGQTSELATFSHCAPPSRFFLNCSIKKMASTSNKCQLQLAFQTFEKDLQLNIYKATQFYNILCITLSTRINGVSIRENIITNSQKLTTLEKEVVVREVFNIDSRRFPPRIYNVKDIVNWLLMIYDAICVGLRWTFNFVKRQPKLHIYWNRLYNYQRA